MVTPLLSTYKTQIDFAPSHKKKSLPDWMIRQDLHNHGVNWPSEAFPPNETELREIWIFFIAGKGCMGIWLGVGKCRLNTINCLRGTQSLEGYLMRGSSPTALQVFSYNFQYPLLCASIGIALTYLTVDIAWADTLDMLEMWDELAATSTLDPFETTSKMLNWSKYLSLIETIRMNLCRVNIQ